MPTMSDYESVAQSVLQDIAILPLSTQLLQAVAMVFPYVARSTFLPEHHCVQWMTMRQQVPIVASSVVAPYG
jgi:hypothetical protein